MQRMDTCRSDTDVRALEMTRVSLVIAVVAKTRGSARLVVNAVAPLSDRVTEPFGAQHMCRPFN